ncbi:MAG: hypothetical protein GXP41_01285 [Chloroflexi bacterium]|nr:hypothetical protein [Chloroflexota bacterium]
MILWLDQIDQNDIALTGGKAANLGAMAQAGFPTPAGFCLTTRAWREFVEQNQLEEPFRQVPGSPETLADLRAQITQAPIPESIVALVRQAYRELPARLPDRAGHVGTALPVAVRSSATAEDLPSASFAGQQDTFLNVTGLDDILQHIQACWASAWSDRAVQYRQTQSLADVSVAVVVQAMVPCRAAGVAFSLDPLNGAESVTIEAVEGLGDRLMSGSAEPVRYRVSRQGTTTAEPRESTILSPRQVQHLAKTVRQLEAHFGQPQDVEWGYVDDTLYLFQSRPITVQEESFFNQSFPDENRLWAAGFLNERFPQPVTPLGWSLIRSLLEPLAFRDPLHYLGIHDLDDQPLTRLYRGHPYTDAGVFWRIYKLFPDALLPEDAVRYFPGNDVSLRKRMPTPRWGPRLLWNVLRAALADWQNWSSLHNWRAWQRFVPQHHAALQTLDAQADRAMAALAQSPAAAGNQQEVWKLIMRAQDLNKRLLAVHRWSLVHADLTYTLLRRLCLRLLGPEKGAEVAAAQVTQPPTRSFRLDEALQNLAGQARTYPSLGHAVRTASWPELLAQLPSIPQGPAFRAALEQFLAQYGHRAYSLDIYQPTFQDDPEQVLTLIRDLAQNEGRPRPQRAQVKPENGQPWQIAPLRPLTALAQRYVLLREEQRFFWQQILARQRRLVVALGTAWAGANLLDRADDIFFLTLDEIGQALATGRRDGAEVAGRRRIAHEKLCRDEALLPDRSYPDYLRGDTPVRLPALAGNGTLRGQPVSPGVARGPVRVIRTPGDFDKLHPGDILVTTSPDPGWTPVFGILAGLIMERGGQLSHGAVVAREYGLPAITSLPGVTGKLRDDEWVLVDGRAGIVQRIDNA